MEPFTTIWRIISVGFKQLKGGVMVGISSSGLFGNLGANQGKLNTRKGRSFLAKDATRRMQGKDYKMDEKSYSKSKLKDLKARLRSEAALERQKNILILVNSALVVALTLMIIAWSVNR